MWKDGNGIYKIDFVFRGRRVQFDTKTKNLKKAKAIEQDLREATRKDVERLEAAGKGPLTMDFAAERYWNERGQYHANDADTHRDLERLVQYFGKSTRLDKITDREVAAMVAWRASQTIGGKKTRADGRPMPRISAATVNRSTTQLLKRLFGRAKRVWRYSFPDEPIWSDHLLKEPKERVRELLGDEGQALDANVRNDYAAWLEFARMTGRRRAETLIRWSQVNWDTNQIISIGKNGERVITQITQPLRALLEPLVGHHPDWVFTYIAQKTQKGRVRGQRYPITYDGSKTEWRRTRDRARIDDLRFHDLRHDFGSKLLRQTGNLKLAQKAMNHADIKTTMRYVHVLDEEVSNALEIMHSKRRELPEKLPEPSGRASQHTQLKRKNVPC